LWGDDTNVKAPRRYVVQHWDGSRWIDATVVSQLPEQPATWAVNRVRLRPVTTQKVRVLFEHTVGAATGVTELMIWPPDPFAVDVSS
jgi:hypothetical protein